MEKSLVEKVILGYEEATGNKIDGKKINLASEASWSAKKALDSLEYEPTGNLAILLIRKAWEEFLNESHLKIRELLNPDFEKDLETIRNFNKEMREGEAGKILDSTIATIKKISEKFGINEFDSIDVTRFIDIFEECFSNIYRKYEVDKILCSDTKEGEPFIAVHEYHFKTLKDFVDCLKRSNNCIAYAKIDALYDYEETDEYDVFFAFGCRCGNYVYVNSPRDDHATPVSRAIKKTRNPGKKLRNMADGTYMPYYDLIGKKEVSTDTALVSVDPNLTPIHKICELYDLYAKLAICTSIAAVYQKYFIDKTVDIRYNSIERAWVPVTDSYFGEEIKLLPNKNTTALALPGELQLPVVSRHDLEMMSPDIYAKNIGFWDWYVKEYIKDDELNEPVAIKEFIGNKREAERRVWWTYRNMAKTLVNERRTKDIAKDFYCIDTFKKTGNLEDLSADLREYDSWGKPINASWEEISGYKTYFLRSLPTIHLLKNFSAAEKLSNNLEIIIRDILTGGTNYAKNTGWGHSSTYYLNDKIMERDETGLEYIIAENLENPNFRADTLDRDICSASDARSDYNHLIKYKNHKEYQRELYNKDFNARICYQLDDDTIDVIIGDAKNKDYEFKLKATTVYDLCYLLGVKRNELPKALRRWLSKRRCFHPDTGNHILNVTDPMDRMFDWVDECFSFEICVYTSKSELNKLAKKLNVDLNIRDREWRND